MITDNRDNGRAERGSGSGSACLQDQDLFAKACYLDAILCNISEVVSVLDAAGTITYITPSVEQALGITQEEMIGTNAFEHVHPDDIAGARERLEQALVHPGPNEPLVVRLRSKNNGWRTIESQAISLLEHPEIRGIVMTSRDVTTRREMEAALLESEEKWRTLVENAPNIITIADRDGALQFINRTVTGISVDQVIGRTIYDFLDPQYHETVRKTIHNVFATGEPGRYKVSGTGPNGTTAWYETYVGSIRRDNQVVAATCFTIDITERLEVDRELKKSRQELRDLNMRLNEVREDERGKVAREIHDGLGQSLAVLSMQLELLRANPPKRPDETSEKLLSMAGLVERSVSEMRRICTELRPGVLDHLGLAPAIEWQTSEFQERTRVRCHVRADLDGMAVDPGLATALFRILQESLANIARHSGADEAWITCEERDGWIELVITDDGAGITEDQTRGPASLGLAGMRERAREWGGDLDVTGVADEGTTVTVRVPLHKRTGEDD